MHQFAELTFQTDQSFGALANRLVARGFVGRVPGPGRAQRHALTPAGERLRREGQRVADDVLAASFESLTGQERATLLELLMRINSTNSTPR